MIFITLSQIHAKPGRIIIYSNGAMRSKCALRRLSGPHISLTSQFKNLVITKFKHISIKYNLNDIEYIKCKLKLNE